MTDQKVDADAFNTFEAAGWEQQAGGYEDFFAPISNRLADPLLDDASVGSDTRVLDVATGPGFVAAKAAERGAVVVGVDVAAAMVALARRLHPQLDFRQGDAEALPLPDGSFDAVVANLLMLHLGRPERGVPSSYACSPPAAGCADGLGRSRSGAADRRDARCARGGGSGRAREIPVGPPFFRFSDEQEFARLLRDQGLEDVAVRTIAFTHREPPRPRSGRGW